MKEKLVHNFQNVINSPFHRKSSLNSVTIEKMAGHIVQKDKCCCISVQEKLPADKQMNMKEFAVVDPAV